MQSMSFKRIFVMLCKRKSCLRTASPGGWLWKNLRFPFSNTLHKTSIHRESYVQFTGTTIPPENPVGQQACLLVTGESDLSPRVSSSVNVISHSQRPWKVLVSISNPSHAYLIIVVTISWCSHSLCLLQKNIYWYWSGSDCLVSGKDVETFHNGERRVLGFVSCPS